MLNLLWFVVAVLLVIWILSIVAFHLGAILWIFLIAAIVVAAFNLFSGGSFSRS